MKDNPRTWARRGLSLLLSLSMAIGSVPASAYAEALESSIGNTSAEAEVTENNRGEESTEVQETQPQPEAEEQQVPEDEQQPQAEEQQEEASEDGNPAQEQAPPAMPAFDGEAQVDDVIVRVHADEGAFPEGVHLEASYVDEGTARTATEAANEMLPEDQNIAESVVLDVRVVGAEGSEVEPANGIAVQVSFQKAQIADENLNASVFHVLDDGAIVELDAAENGDVVSASTMSFSTYVVTLSTGSGSVQYELPQGGTTASQILHQLGILTDGQQVTKITVCTTTDAGVVQVTNAGENDYAVTPGTKSGSATLTVSANYQFLANVDTGSGSTSAVVQFGTLGPVSITVNSVKQLIPITDCVIAPVPDQVYEGGSAIEPALTVTYGETQLEAGTDYTVTYSDNTNIGQASYTVKAKEGSDYSGSTVGYFNIVGDNTSTIDLTNATVTVEPATFDGTNKFSYLDPTNDKIIVKVGGASVGSNDYFISGDTNTMVDAGNYAFVVNGQNGASGSARGTFTINPAPATVKANDAQKTLGQPDPASWQDRVEVTGEVTGYPIDWAVSCHHAEAVGTYKIDVEPGPNASTANKNYDVTYVDGTFTINEAVAIVISDFDVPASVVYGDHAGNKAPVTNVRSTTSTPEYTIPNDQYDVAYEDNENVGTATVTVTGKNGVTGSLSKTFEITKRPVTVSSIKAENKEYDNTRDATFSYDAVVLDGKLDGDDLSVTATGEFDNRNVGVDKDVAYTAALSGADARNYTLSNPTGTVKANITARSATLTFKDISKVYGEQDPEKQTWYTVEGLLEGDTFSPSSVSRQQGEDVGTYDYQWEITDLPNYNIAVNADAKFTITPKAATVTADAKTKYAGEADPELTATVTGTVGSDTLDYTLTREHGDEPGTYVISAVGAPTQGNYTVTYLPGILTIGTHGDIASVEVSPEEYIYSGQPIVPTSLTVKTASGETLDPNKYDVTYANNTNAGEATVIVQGKGGYTGMATGTFTIKPKAVVVRPDDRQRVYGGQDPQLTYQVLDPLTRQPVEVAEGNALTVVVTRQQGEDVGTYPITATGGNDQGNYKVTFETGTFTISQRRLRVRAGITASDKTYDGTADAELDFSKVAFDNLVPGDEVTVTATGAFEGKDVAYDGGDVAAKRVNITDVAISGPKAHNYALVADNQAATEARIYPKQVGVSGITAKDKVYDGTKDAELVYTGLAIDGVVDGETVTATATGTFADKNVGEGKDVAISGIELGGDDAANYALAAEGTQASTTASITPKEVTVSGITTKDKYYDGTKDAELDWSHPTLDGVVEGDDVTIAGARGSFEDAEAGEGKTVAFDLEDPVTLEGADAGNYVAKTDDGHPTSAKIMPVKVKVSVDAGQSKTYGDDDPAAYATTLEVTEPAGYDKLTPAQIGERLGYKAVRAEGEAAGDYDVTFEDAQGNPKGEGELTEGNFLVTYAKGTFTINRKAATVTPVDAGKAYGEQDPELEAVVDGTIEGDTLDYAVTREEGQDVGEYDITAAAPVPLPAGSKNNNYEIEWVVGTFTIGPADTIAGAKVSVPDQDYTGSQIKPGPDDVTVTLDGEELALGTDYEIDSYGENVNAGNGAGTVTIRGKGNYSGTATGRFSIRPIAVTVTPKDASKVYGQEDPNLSYEVTDGQGAPVTIADGNILTVVLARQQGEDVGAYTITATGGNDQGNYKVTFETGIFTISQRRLRVRAGITASDKTYDGTADAELDFSKVAFDNLVPGDEVTVTATGAFEDKNVAYDGDDVAAKRVSITDIAISGPKAHNYALVADNQAATEARIYPKQVGVSGITAADKPYDGTTEATLDLSAASVDGKVEGDDVAVESARGDFASKDVRRNADGEVITKRVTITEIGLGGADAGNYVVEPGEGAQATASAKVEPRPVTVTGLVPKPKPYDGTTDAEFDVSDAQFAAGDIVEIDGVPDDVEVESATGQFTTADVGTGKAIGQVEVTLRGADAGNYAPKADPDHYNDGEIDPNRAKLTVGTFDKTYGEKDPEFTWSIVPELEDKLDFKIVRDEGEDVGDYAIKVEGVEGKSEVVTRQGTDYLRQGGYEVEIVPGKLTIKAKEVTVTPKDCTKTYGDPDPTFEADVEGVLENDNFAIAYTVTRGDTSEDVGAYELTASGDELQGNYRVTYANDPAHHLTITAKRVVVASGITAGSKVYDKTTEAKLTFPDAVEGVEDGDDVKVTGTGMFADENAGLNKTVRILGLALEGADAGNYELDVEASQAEAVADIYRRPVKVTVDGGQTKVYGDTDPALKATVEQAETDEAGRVTNDRGLVYGDAVHYDLGRDAGEDVGTYALKATGEPAQPNYDVEFVDGTLAITPRTVYVDGIRAEDKVYDGTDAATLALDGARVHDPAFGDELSVRATGTFASKDVFRRGGEVASKRVDIAGIELVGPKAANYVVDADGSQKTTSARITPASVSVSGITATDKTYDGTADADLDLSGATLETVFGSDDVTVASATGAFASKDVRRDADGNVLTKRVDVTGVELGGEDAGNYYVEPEEGTQATASAKILPKQVVVSDIKAKDKAYDGTTDVELDCSGAKIAGLVADDEGKVVVVSAEGEFKSPNVGDAVQVDLKAIDLGPAEGAAEDVSGNYEPVGDDQHVPAAEIRALAVTVTVDAGQSKVYGEQNPDAYTATVTPGLAAGDVAYETTRAAGEDAGTYAITFVNPQEQQGNYKVSYVDGTYAITPRPVTVTPRDDLSKTYGESDPDWTALDEVSDVTYTGDESKEALVGGDRLAYTVSRAAGEDAGTYDVTAEGAGHQGGSDGRNYEVTYANPGKFTINTLEVTVTADNQSKIHGEQDPTLTATVDPDPLPFAGDEIKYELDRVKGEDGGQSYAIFFVNPAEYQSGHAGSDAPNYHVTYVNGRLGVDQKPVTITADDLTKTYGDETPELTATVDGAPAALVEYRVVLDPDDPNNAPDKVEDAGEHRLIVVADADQGSYKVEVRAGKLTIGRAPVTVRADDASKVYDNDPANPDKYTATVTGLKRGDDKSVLTYEVKREPGEDVGTYKITPTGEESQGNYTVTYEDGTFTIGARTVTARGFQAADKEYDGTTDATVTGGKVYDGDTEVQGVTIDAAKLSGEFADRHAGDDKTVTISGIELSGDAARNYALDLEGSQTKTLASISPRPIKVTADDVEKTYGDEDPASYTATVTYDGDADPAPSPVVVTGDKIDYGLHRSVESHNGQFDPVSEYVIYVTGSPYQGDYKVAYANGMLKVNKREITLAKGVTATSKVYDGDADATATLDLTGAEFANTVNGDKVTLASATGTYVEQGTETANKNAGPRDVLLTELAIDDASARNYVLADAGNQKYAENGNEDGSDLQIIRRKVKVVDDSITVMTDGSRTYDATAVAGLDLATATFDDVVEGETVTLKEGQGTGTFVNDEGEPDKNVGEGKKVNVTGIALDDGNEQNANYELVDAYPAEDAAKSVTAVTHGDITPLAVKVEGIYAKTREYDGTDVAEMSEDSDPRFVTKASEDDDLVVESATVKFQGANAAPLVEQYGMVTEIVLGGEDAPNYSVDPASFGPTRGKIVPREIDVTADDKEKTYGEDDPELTVTYRHVGDATQPALIGDDELVFTTLAREAGEDVGTYKITVAGNEYQSGDVASPATPQNYHVANYDRGEYGAGTLTIKARPVVVSIDTAGKGRLSKTYGEDDPELRAVVAYDGDESRPALVRGDELDYEVVREAGEDVRSGGYVVKYVDSRGADKPLNTPVAEGNYVVTYVPSTLVIETKEVKVRIDDKSKAFGAEDPKWTVTYVPADALVWRRDLGRRDQLRYTVDRVKGEDGGQSYAAFFVNPEAYQSGRTDSVARNYHVTYVGGRLSISRRSVTVTANSLSKAYGAKDPTLTAKVSGVTKGDSITYTLSRAKGENVGTYTITPKGERVQGSYVVTYKTGKLTIRQANVTVKADDLSKNFGDKDPKLTATVTGVKKGETVKYTLRRAKGEAVGKYKITVTAAANQGNYKVTTKNGTLTIGEPPSLFVAGEAHCQSIGWVKSVYGGDWMGTTGQSKRMEAFTAKVENAPYSGGITYRSHVQTTGWQGWVKDGDLSGTWGQSRRLEATQIKLYGELARRYDVYYRVHAQTYGWLAWAKNGEMSGTAGQSKRLEAMQIVIVRKGAKAPGASYHGVVQQFGKAFIG